MGEGSRNSGEGRKKPRRLASRYLFYNGVFITLIFILGYALERATLHNIIELSLLSALIGLLSIYSTVIGGIPDGLLSLAAGVLLLTWRLVGTDIEALTPSLTYGLRIYIGTVTLAVLIVGLLRRYLNLQVGRLSGQLQDIELEAERYRSLLNNTTVGIFRTGLDGKLLDANQALANIVGYKSVDELIDDINEGRFEPYIEDRRREEFLEEMKRGKVTNFVSRIMTRDGRMLWISESARTIDDGESVSYQGTVIDVTAQIESERQAKQYDRFMEALNEVSIELLTEREPTSMISRVLDRAVGLLGTSHGFVHMMEGDSMVMKYATGEFSEDIGFSAKMGRGLAGKVWETGEPVIVDDYSSYDERVERYEGLSGAVLAVPMKAGGKVVGIMGVSNLDNRRTFSSFQVMELKRLAEVAGLALQNAALDQELERFRDRYSLLLDNANDGIITIDSTGHITQFNRASELLLGYGAGEVMGKSVTILLTPIAANRMKTLGLKKSMISEEGIDRLGRTSETSLLTKDGKTLEVEMSLYDWRSERQTFYTGFIRDLSEQKAAREAARESEARFRMIVEGVKEYAIFMLDKEGHVISWNDGAQRINGYSEEEIIGQHFSVFYPSEERYRCKDILETAKYRGKYTELGWRIRKSGDRYWANVLLTALYDETGRLTGFAKVVKDETQEHNIEEMKRDFIALVSHQLKTPIALIRGYVENMLNGLTGELTDHQRQYLTDIQEISLKNYGLINDLLNLSRIERGVISADIRPVELSSVIDYALRDHRPALKRKGLKLSVDLPEGLYVQADLFKMGEAMGNVIDNAIKFTDQGGLTISADTRDGRVYVTVKDTGSGITKQNMGKLFNKDVVMGGRPRGEISGAGLGLYIAKEFMNIQQGDISVESKLGEGTEFTFQIPQATVGKINRAASA